MTRSTGDFLGAADGAKGTPPAPLRTGKDEQGNILHFGEDGLALSAADLAARNPAPALPTVKKPKAASGKPTAAETPSTGSDREILEPGVVVLSGEALAQKIKEGTGDRRSVAGRVRQPRVVKNAAYFAGQVARNGRKPIIAPREALGDLAGIHQRLTGHVDQVKNHLLSDRQTRSELISAGTGQIERDFTVNDMADPNYKNLKEADGHLDNAAHHINALMEYIKTPKSHFHHAYASAAANSLLAAHSALSKTDFPAADVDGAGLKQTATILDGQNRELGGGVIKANGEYQPKKRGNQVVVMGRSDPKGRNRNETIRVTPGMRRKAEMLRGTGQDDEAIDKFLGGTGEARVAGQAAKAETEARLVEQGRSSEEAEGTQPTAETGMFGGRGRKAAPTVSPRRRKSAAGQTGEARTAGKVNIPRVDSQGNPITVSSARTGNTVEGAAGAEADLNSGSRMPRPEDALRGLSNAPVRAVVEVPVASEVTGLAKQEKDENGNWVPVVKKAVLKRKVKSRATGLTKQTQDKDGNWVPVTQTVSRTGATTKVVDRGATGAPTPNPKKSRKARMAAANTAAEAAVAATEAAGKAAAADAARRNPAPRPAMEAADRPKPGTTRIETVENVTTAPAKRGRRVVSKDKVTREVPNPDYVPPKPASRGAEALRRMNGSTDEDEAALKGKVQKFLNRENGRARARTTAQQTDAEAAKKAAAKKKTADRRAAATNSKRDADRKWLADQVAAGRIKQANKKSGGAK
jgi:hypothetical protein